MPCTKYLKYYAVNKEIPTLHKIFLFVKNENEFQKENEFFMENS
jgi:hypothetical protein